jgi:diguanylate cyclase (GGDEF)-like protein
MSTASIPIRQRHVAPVVGVVVALSLAALATALLYFIAAKAQLETDSQARSMLGEAREQIDYRLRTALAVPETLAAVIAAEERIDRRTFNAIASRLIQANPSIRNVALAPDGVIAMIYPVRGNEATLGVRYADLPRQNEGVLRAIETRRTVIAGPIDLLQGGTGMVSRTPVFLRDASGQDTRYWGIVALAVDTDQLFVDIARIAQRSGLQLAVRSADPGQAPGPVFSGDAAVFTGQPVSMHYSLPGGGRWELGALPRPDWTAADETLLAARLLLYLLAAALGWVAYRVVASRYHHQELARRDPLTGLSNRKSFDHRLKTLLKQAKPRSCALVLIDLDDFKPVNDTHGHAAGDQVLQEIAERLRQLIRGTDTVYRLGGDEFALLLQDIRAEQDVLGPAQRALQRIGQPIMLDDTRSVRAGASAGVAVFPLGGESERASAVFDRADRALYRSKARGGNILETEPPAPGSDAAHRR